MTHWHKRLAAELGKGDFIPSRFGSIGFGYDLWATHPNGDVIVYCGGNARWFDWFRPVQPGDDPDFELTINGRQYRLVRGVDDIPSQFKRPSQEASPSFAQPVKTRRPGLPTVRQRQPQIITRAAVEFSPLERPFVVEQFENGMWHRFGDHKTIVLARQDGDRYLRFHGTAFRVVCRGEVVHEWRPEGATA